MAGKTVVLAVDGSESSAKTLKWVAECILNKADKAVIVHVEPGLDNEPGLHLYPEAAVPPGLMAAVKKKRRERSEDLMRKMRDVCDKHKVEAQTEIVEGDPRTSLLSAVRKHDASLLVVGSRNLGLLERAFLGSVSKYCVQNSPCPVLVYRDAL